MDLLILPSPARNLWDRAAHVLDRALAQFRNRQPAWHLGGGTLLAARWNHRSSTDIDLTVPAGAGIETLHPDYGCTFSADMKAAGAVNVSIGEVRHVIEFEDGRIDLAEMDSRPASGHEPAAIGGHSVFAKSTTQILRGKLERALSRRTPARDVFDVAVAHRAAPRALAQAVSMLSSMNVVAIASEWHLSSYRLEQDGTENLQGVNPEYADEHRFLVERGIEHLTGAIYHHLRMRTAGQQLIVDTTTRAGLRQRQEWTRTELSRELEATGLNAFLDRRIGNRKTLLERIRHNLSNRTPDAVVFEWTQPPLPQIPAIRPLPPPR